MPTYKDITVHVTDNTITPLTEYGIRKLDRKGLSTCYIQSKTNMPFCISIMPGAALLVDEEEEEEEEGEISEDETPRMTAQNFTGPDPIDEFGRSMLLRRPRTPSPPPPKEKWHLLATLRLDGRQQYEKRSIIYLSPSHLNFNYPYGEVTIRYRILRDPESGELKECGWLFKEVGIETVFETLLLAGEGEKVLEKDEDELATAFAELGKDGLQDSVEKSTVGQIEVTLERILLGEVVEESWEPDSDHDADTKPGSKDLAAMSHTAARDGGKKSAKRAGTVYYDLLNKREAPYATFRFYYRGEDTLRKLRFLPPVPSTTVATQTGKRDTALRAAAAAPLSILNPSTGIVPDEDLGEKLGELTLKKRTAEDEEDGVKKSRVG